MFNNKLNIFKTVEQEARVRKAKTFRKRLGIYNFKVKPNKYYNNPHVMPFHIRETLKKQNNSIAFRKYYHIKIHSNKPFGYFSKKYGTFHFEHSRVPNYDIPDTTGFYLKPYFPKHPLPAPSFNPEDKSDKFNNSIMSRIRTSLLLSDDKQIRRLGLEIFETEFGKSMVKEFIENQNKRGFFDEVDMKIRSNRMKVRANITDKDFRNKLRYEEIPVFEDTPSVALNILERETMEMDKGKLEVHPWFAQRYPEFFERNEEIKKKVLTKKPRDATEQQNIKETKSKLKPKKRIKQIERIETSKNMNI